MVSKQVQTSVEIASFNIPRTFLVGEVSLNCILRSDFLAKTAAEVDFKAKKLRSRQGDKTKTAPVQEEIYDKEDIGN